MDYEKMWDELMKRAKTDPWYQECLLRVREAEIDYIGVLEKLSTKDKQIVEDYIAACEIMDDCMTVLAYQIGSER